MLTALVALPDGVFAEAVRAALTRDGWHAVAVTNAEAACRVAQELSVDILITEDRLPPVAGRSLLQWLCRLQPASMPATLMLVDPGTPVTGPAVRLERPVGLSLLVERATAMAGRQVSPSAPGARPCPFTLDATSQTVRGPGGGQRLTRTEFGVLATLLQYAPQVTAAGALAAHTTGAALRVHMAHLRRKLGSVLGAGVRCRLTAVPGGYRLTW